MITPGKNRIGSLVYLTASFSDDAGDYADPSALTAKVQSEQTSRVTEYTYGSSSNLTRTATGRYQLAITPTEGGRWSVRWVATLTAGNLVLEDSFIVQTSPFVDQPPIWGDYA